MDRRSFLVVAVFWMFGGAPAPAGSVIASPALAVDSLPTATPTPPPPANDGCTAAAWITALPFSQVLDTRGASTDALDPYPSCGTGSRDRRVWYRYAASTTGAITLSTDGSNYATIISTYTGTCGALAPVANGCDAGQGYYYPARAPQLAMPVTAGTIYYLMVSAAQSDGGLMSLSVSAGMPLPTPTLTRPPTQSPTVTPVPPVNDGCGVATLVAGLPFADQADTRGAGTDETDPYPSCGTHSRDRRVWYRYAAPADGFVTLDSTGSNYATIISAYTGTCGAPAPVADGCDASDYYAPSGTQMSIAVTAGTTYYFMVSANRVGPYQFGGSLSLHINAVPPTAIPSLTPTRTWSPTPAPTPPPNDSCADGMLVATLPFTDAADVRGAGIDETDPYPSCGNHSRDRRVWYRYVAPATGFVTLDTTGSSYAPIIAAYTGSCGALIPVDNGCSAANSNTFPVQIGRLSIPVTAGVTYYFMISSATNLDPSSFSGRLALRITAGMPSPTPFPTSPWHPTPIPSPPPNNSCAAGTLMATLPFSDTADVRGASTDATDPYPTCGNHSRDRRVWYRYVAPTTGTVTLDTTGTSYSMIVAAYTGDCGALVPVTDGCASGAQFGGEARLSLPVTADTTYFFMVSASSLDTYALGGRLSLHVIAGTPTATVTATATRTRTPTLTVPPPPNDSCAGGTLITTVPFADAADVRNASTDAYDPYPPCGTQSHDRRVWYRYVAPAAGAITIDTAGSSYYTIVSAYTGGCGALVPVENGCDTGFTASYSRARLSIAVTAGTAYYFMVSAWDVSADQTWSLHVSVTPADPASIGNPTPLPTPWPTPIPPPNDSCIQAAIIASAPFWDVVDTRGASTDATDPYPNCGGGSRDRRVWYRYVAPANGTVTADTFTSDYRTIVSAYVGTCGALQPIDRGCDAGDFNGRMGRLSLPVLAGATYFFMVSATDHRGGTLGFSLVPGVPPSTPTATLTATATMPPTPAPPPNDACSAAAPITPLPYFDVVETDGASISAQDPAPPCGSGSRDRRVWYRFTAVSDGAITLGTSDSTYTAIISAYTGTCGALVPVDNGCAAGAYLSPAQLTMPVTAGVTYYVMVSANDHYGGFLVLSAASGGPSPTATPTPFPTSKPPPTPVPPPNDGCGEATEIDALPYFDVSDTRGATTAADDPYPVCANSRDRRVWYRLTPTSNGQVTFDASGSTYSLIISAYTGTCGAFVPIRNGCSLMTSLYGASPQFSLPVSAGTTYWIMLSAADHEGGFLALSAVAGGPTPTPTATPWPTMALPPTPMPPPNDACTDAALIDAVPYFNVVNAMGASTSAEDPYPPCGSGSRDRRVWYRFDAVSDGALTFDTSDSTYDTIMSAYTGTCGTLVPVSNGCAANTRTYSPAQLTIPVAAGTTYYLMVSASSPPGGFLGLSVVPGRPTPTPTAPPPPPTNTARPIPVRPANDACDQAAAIDMLPYFDAVDTNGASTNAADPYPACGSGSRDRRVWYRFDATTDETIAVDTSDSNYDTIVSVYTGSCGALVPVPDGCGAMRGQLNVPVVASQRYYVMVSASRAQAGILAFTVVHGELASTPTATPTPVPPANDRCDDATEIVAIPFIDPVDMLTAQADPADPVPSCGSGGESPSVWYRLVAPLTGVLTIDAVDQCGADTVVSAYTGNCGLLVALPAGCHAASDPAPPLTMAVTQGTTYYFMVSGASPCWPWGTADVVGFRVFSGTMPQGTPAGTLSPSPTPTLRPPTPRATASATATRTLSPTACGGDCDGNGSVTVDEILTMVNLALGGGEISVCPAADINGDNQVTVDEILTAVDHALNGC
ncbi:MAG: hypothetical protein ACHQ9S_06180 [Candidatus Binatia bacterium]